MTETDPEKRLIGYACISTYGRMLDTQLSRAHLRRRRRSGIGRLTDPKRSLSSGCGPALHAPKPSFPAPSPKGALFPFPAPPVARHIIALIFDRAAPSHSSRWAA